LARAQEKLQQDAQEVLRELTRLGIPEANQDLADAGEQMEQASGRMQRGEQAAGVRAEALDRLQEARRSVNAAKQEMAEELAREKLVKVADDIKRLQSRQHAAVAEGQRVHDAGTAEHWRKRPLLLSLGQLAHAQQDLGRETQELAQGKLAEAKVFARILGKAAQAMKQAGARMLQFQEQLADRDPDDRNITDAESLPLQQEAARRLDQLLQALEPEKGRTPQVQSDDGSPRGRASAGDGVSLQAQLKGLRLLQQDINERTEAFGKRHQRMDKLTDTERRELQGLRQQQQDVAQWLDNLTTPAAAEKEQP
jgi:hypothetical protein